MNQNIITKEITAELFVKLCQKQKKIVIKKDQNFEQILVNDSAIEVFVVKCEINEKFRL